MNAYCMWCICFCSFGAFFYGYDSGLTTSIIAYPEFIEYYGFTATTLGALGSCYYAGQSMGSFLNLWLPDKYGRLRTVQISCVIAILGSGMQTGSQSLGVLLAGRAIGGLACGIVFSLCPAYAAEISPPGVRGRVGGFYSININVAYAITEWMGLGFAYISGAQLKFRLFLGLQVAIAVAMLIASIWMPESPRHLVQTDRHDEALKVLRKLHEEKRPKNSTNSGEANNTDEIPFYQREFNQIQAQIGLEREQEKNRLGLKSIFARPSYRKRLYLVLFYLVMQQLTGIIPLQNYQTILYRALGMKGKMPLVLVGIWGTVGTIFSALGGWFFDRLGRRRSYFISISGVMTGSILLIIFWARFEAGGNTSKTLGSLAVTSMFIYLCGYGWIMNAFGYTYPPEVLPTQIRATGMGLGFGLKMVSVIMLVQVTPIAVKAVSWRYFLTFIFLQTIFVVVFYFFFPETAGIPLEEVARVFGDEVAVTLDEADKGVVTATEDEKARQTTSVEQVEDSKR